MSSVLYRCAGGIAIPGALQGGIGSTGCGGCISRKQRYEGARLVRLASPNFRRPGYGHFIVGDWIPESGYNSTIKAAGSFGRDRGESGYLQRQFFAARGP